MRFAPLLLALTLAGCAASSPDPTPLPPLGDSPTPVVVTLSQDCLRMDRYVGRRSFTGNPYDLAYLADGLHDSRLRAVLSVPGWTAAPRVWRAVAEARRICAQSS